MDRHVVPGSRITVHGRNLTTTPTSGKSYVLIKPTNAAGRWASVDPATANPFRVEFTVPSDLAPGNYEVWVHNGHGGHTYGWSGPLALLVESPLPAVSKVFSVRDFPRLAGETDDTGSIDRAYAAASTFHSANPAAMLGIYLPAGTYVVHHGFGLLSNTVWYGDGMDRTIIQCGPGFDDPNTPDPLITHFGVFITNGGNVQNFELRDLTIDANGHISPDGTLPNRGLVLYLGNSNPASRFVKLTNLRVNAPGIGYSGFLMSINNLAIEGCEFSNTLLFGGNTDVAIRTTTFVGDNNSETFVRALATINLSMVKNIFKNRQGAAPGSGRVLVGQGNWGTQRHVYFADNTTVALGPSTATNSGEQVLYEGQATLQTGKPAAVATTQLTYANQPAGPDLSGQALTAVIVAGTGLGQYRPVTYQSPSSFAVSPPWTVAPDSSSTVLVTHAAERVVVYHNMFAGRPDYATVYSSVTAVEQFGGTYDWIVDSNAAVDLHAGFASVAIQQHPGPDPMDRTIVSTQPVWNSLFSNNQVTGCNTAIVVTANDVVGDTNFEGVAMLGNVWRRNVFRDVAVKNTPPEVPGGAIAINGLTNATTPGSPLHTTVWEYNTFTNVPKGVFAGTDPNQNSVKATDLLFYRNQFDRGTGQSDAYTGFVFGPLQFPGLRENTWTGFTAVYSGVTPGPVLEVPNRVVALTWNGSNWTGTLRLWNSGTAAASWTASTNAPWLRLGTTAGTIATERDAFNLQLSSTAAASGPVLTGIVTVKVGTQTKSATVVLRAPGG